MDDRNTPQTPSSDREDERTNGPSPQAGRRRILKLGLVATAGTVAAYTAPSVSLASSAGQLSPVNVNDTTFGTSVTNGTIDTDCGPSQYLFTATMSWLRTPESLTIRAFAANGVSIVSGNNLGAPTLENLGLLTGSIDPTGQFTVSGSIRYRDDFNLAGVDLPATIAGQVTPADLFLNFDLQATGQAACDTFPVSAIFASLAEATVASSLE